jgi:ligand-binding sensor domain-containing protein/DNA-binding CsgD family transcriptional regulator
MKISCCIIFYMMASNFVVGQNTIGLPMVNNFTKYEFKGGKQTWDIKQDKQGRMYFANNEGLITYDGSYFKVYPQPNKSILRSIAINNKRIYAGGQDEIGFYSPDANGTLRYSSLLGLIPSPKDKFTDVWEIEVYKESVFFRTWDCIFEYKNGAIRSYQAKTGWQFMKLAGNRLIAQDKNNGLFQFIDEGWQPMCSKKSIPDFEITGIIPLNNDSLLISSLQNGMFVFHKGEFTRKIIGNNNSILKNNIYTLEKINNNTFAAGTTSEGCLILSASGNIIQQIAKPEGLQNNNVLCVFIDRDDNIWAGLDNGISFIAYSSAIKYLKPGKNQELSGYSSRIFHNKLYIATSNGAFVASLPGANTDLSFSKSDFEQIKNSEGQNWRLDEVNQQLLLGHNNGSFRIQDNIAVQLTHDAGIWLFVPTTSIFPVKYVLAGSYAGITLLDFIENKYVGSLELKGLYESLRFLTIDNDNNIWASHPYRGIYKIRLAADNKSFSSQLFTNKDGLPSTLRNNVFRVKNRVVFATERGVYEFDSITKKFVPSPAFLKIFGDTGIQYLIEDSEGSVWFCSDNQIGMVRFDDETSSHSITYFPELKGKLLSGFESIYPYNRENIFIASNDGVIHLNYEKYVASNPKLNILLSQVKTFGKSDSVIWGGYFDSNGDTSLNKVRNPIIKLPINNNSFHFEFSSPSFSFKNNIEYSYQLEGYENKWSSSSTKTEKEYTNLPSGKYTFKVKARNNLGKESETSSYSFVINPAWYETIWAYAFYTMLLGVVSFLFIKWQKKKFHKQRIKFEEEEKKLKYIHQLEVEKNEKEIIKLQNEKLVNEVIFKNRELADASMHLVERSDALQKVKSELQHLHKKTGENHDIKKAIQMVIDIEKTNANWENFASHFDEVNNDFLKRIQVQFPNLTNTDLKLCAYLLLNLASKEIAQLMNIAVRGVEISRYRLRKKLQLTSRQSLIEFLNKYKFQS